jgi:hypothetical protein
VCETVSVSERVKETTCAWCGEPVVYAGVGRPLKYCSDSRRRRASEVRTAARRAARPVSEGGWTTEPVREVVERTATVTRMTVRRGPAKLRLPEDIYEWQNALAQLQSQVRGQDFVRFYVVLLRDLEATAVRGARAPGAPRAVAAADGCRHPGPPRLQGSRKKRRKRR